MTRIKYNAAPSPASESTNQSNETAKRQIYIIMAASLVLFLVTTFVLAGMLPSPAAHTDSMMLGVHPLQAMTVGKIEAKSKKKKRNHSYHLRHDYERLVHKKPDVKVRHATQKSIGEKSASQTNVATEHIHKGGRKDRGNAMDQKSIPAAQQSNANGDKKESERYQMHPLKFARPKSSSPPNAIAGNIHERERSSHLNEIDQKQKPAAQQSVQTDNEIESEEYQPRLIHILETRFMQNQPNLVQLAKARLHLLATVCLPTVLHQTAWGQFLWVIRTDPDLDGKIKKELVSTLEKNGALVKKDEHGKERALTYVIGSNVNYIVSNSTTLAPSARPFDVRGMLSNTLSEPQSIFAGKAENMQMLLDEISSQRAAKDVFLWTRLDADDGLNVRYMEYIQSQAIRYFLPDRYDREIMTEIPEEKLRSKSQSGDVEEQKKSFKNTYTPPQWTYWCAALNIDWFLTDPIRDPDHKNGTVFPVVHANVCVTPGVTVAMRGTFDPLNVPRLDHDKIISHLRPKGGSICKRTGLSFFDPDEMQDDEREDQDDGSCFHLVTLGISAIRSRTPTSAGMLGVNPDAAQLEIVRKRPKIIAFMWDSMMKFYHISNKDLLETNAYFAKHIYDIAEENAKGQCTKGHSCKTTSKDLLQQYVDLKRETSGGFDVIEVAANTTEDVALDTTDEAEEYEPRLIHILETRFMQNQPNLVQLAKARLRLLATICLPTVVHQTAWGQFLWVIRTDPELDDEIKKELVNVLDEAGALVKKDDDGKEHALTYVIGSNVNYIVSNSTTLSPSARPFDVRGMLSDALSKPQFIFAGNAESMQMLFDEISSQRVVQDVFLWTRLDADDGLNVAYMEYIQSQAIRYFLPDRYEREIMMEIPAEKIRSNSQQSKNETLKKSDGVEENHKLIKNTYTPPQWTYWCAQLNIDWFLTDPSDDPDHKNGTVFPVMHSDVCVTPGVTVAVRGAFDPVRVPRLDHDKIISYLRPKGGSICKRTGLSYFDPNEINLNKKEAEDDGSCFHMATGGIAAIRSRTPTSAGMLGVNPDANQLGSVRLQPKLTPFMWQSMKKDFRVLNKDLLGTNAYFAEHVYDIAEENARGQCTKGHSCKSSSKDLLQQYVDLKRGMEGGFDVNDG